MDTERSTSIGVRSSSVVNEKNAYLGSVQATLNARLALKDRIIIASYDSETR
jgi:hypothetical protein